MTGSSAPRVVVVGGGVIGTCCAYWLARAGAAVTLLERGRIAGEASRGNAGTISAGHPPLNRPGRIREGLVRMLDPASPLYVAPRWDPELWRWLLDFARHCTPDAVRHATAVMAPLGQRTLELYDELMREEAIDCGYRRAGYLDVCATEAGLADALADADAVRPFGYRPEPLDPAALRALEPALGDRLVGGVHHPEAATVEPLRFVQGLACAAARRGVRLVEEAPVTDVVVEGGRALGVRLAEGGSVEGDAVVLATGPFSLALARRLGVRLPVQPGKGYHRDVLVGPGGAPPLRTACVLYESSVFCTPMGDRVRFAGTMELSGLNHELRPDRLAQIRRASRVGFPDLGDAGVTSEWCGLRPVSSDGLPVIGALPGVEGAWVATGHGMLGLTLGPVTGEVVAGAVLEGREDPRHRALSPSRLG